MRLQIEAERTRRKVGLTLGDLAALVQHAMASDVPMDATLRATVGVRHGQVVSLTVVPPEVTDGR